MREAVGWSEAVVERRGEFAGRGRRGASVVRHEKMVIPSRMCPMHMHVFPQNGWPGCGAAVRARGQGVAAVVAAVVLAMARGRGRVAGGEAAGGERSELTGR